MSAVDLYASWPTTYCNLFKFRGTLYCIIGPRFSMYPLLDARYPHRDDILMTYIAPPAPHCDIRPPVSLNGTLQPTLSSSTDTVPAMSDQNQNQPTTYKEHASQFYNKQYEAWVPWLEDKYLAWFTKDNKASYTTKRSLLAFAQCTAC